MKLLLCTKCSDVIKLAVTQERSCMCGYVKGGYNEDGLTAWTNGHGVCIAFNNKSLMKSIQCLRFDPNETWTFEAYVRSHEGKTNPNTKIRKE